MAAPKSTKAEPTNPTPQPKEKDDLKKKMGLKYLAINFLIIILVLFVSEVMMGETVLRCYILLLLSLLVALLPLLPLFIDLKVHVDTIGISSSACTLILSILLFHRRFKQGIYMVENIDSVTKEEAEALFSSISPNGATFLFNTTESDIKKIIEKLNPTSSGPAKTATVPSTPPTKLPIESQVEDLEKHLTEMKASEDDKKIFSSTINKDSIGKVVGLLKQINKNGVFYTKNTIDAEVQKKHAKVLGASKPESKK